MNHKILLFLALLFVCQSACKDDDATQEECTIKELSVTTDSCTSDSTYALTLNFVHENAENAYFDLFLRNGQLFGYYKLSDLPLRIEDFPLSGKDYDYIKVCINDNPDCCKEIEFMPPDCEVEECKITEIEVSVGDCTSDETYVLELDFAYENAGNDYFDLFLRNGQLFGYYKLSDVPLRIEDFPLSGKDYDYIKICINDNPNCCKEIEFMPPDCEVEECKITEIEVGVGDCTSDETYVLELDFAYENAGNDYFDLFLRNGQLFGYYKLSDLPLRIEDFPISGKDYDYIKVCINDNPDCCKEIEFMPPDC